MVAISPTYDGSLSRVRLACSGLTGYTSISVQRSLDNVTWTTVRGAAAVTPVSGAATVFDYEFAPAEFNAYRVRTVAPSVVNSLTLYIMPLPVGVWLKSTTRPFLNTSVRLVGEGFQTERSERGGTFDIVGRSLPVAVSDVRGSRRYTFTILTETQDDTERVDLLLASGDILYLHAGPTDVVPKRGVYIFPGRTVCEQPEGGIPLWFTSVQATEVAAPGPDVVGSTSTWATVLSTYATWADVIAAKATWADLLELVGSPSEVLVP